jgi:hypothetical protein
MYAHSLRRRRSSLEPLESRHVLSGFVEATVIDGNLRIVGDNADNHVAIYGGSQPGEVVVAGGTQDGSAAAETQINGKSTQTFNGVRSIFVDMRGGDDRVVATNLNLDGGFRADLGAGNDRFIMRGNFTDQQDIRFTGERFLEYGAVNIGGWLIANGNDGNDSFLTSNLVVHGSVLIGGGLGNDYVQMEGIWNTNRVGQSLVVDAGHGNDTTILRGFTVGGNVHVRDRFAPVRTDTRLISLQVAGEVRFDGSETTDHVRIQGGSEWYDRFTARSLVIITYGGNDNVAVTGATVNSLAILTGEGNDTVHIIGVRANNVTNVNLGNGGDTLNVRNLQSTHIRVQTGFAAADQLNRIVLDRVASTGTARIDAGPSEDLITALDSFYADLAIFLERGVDRLSFERVEMERFQLVNNAT